jgi:hypothetical protein
VINPGQQGPHEQHNYGPGTFIGGDNHGLIRNELLDPKTKATLAKLSKDAPDLASILKKALRDGVISRDAVAALEGAVRSINMDVAEALLLAGRNINEDVAEQLMYAGQNINTEVVNKFVQVKEELSGTACELDHVLRSLHETVGQVNGMQGGSDPGYQFGSAGTATGTAQRTAQVVMRPSPRGTDNWQFRLKLIFWSFGVGFVAGAILIYDLIKR